jgi:hypothetical protein
LNYESKNVFYAAIVLCTLKGYSQHASFDSAWRRNFERNFALPSSHFYDTCYFSNILLKVTLNEKSKITSMQLSDNADPVIKKAIGEMQRKKTLNGFLLENAAKKNKLTNIILVFPVIIKSDGSDCGIQQRDCAINEELFKFRGKRLSGKCQFQQPLSMILWPAVSKQGL